MSTLAQYSFEAPNVTLSGSTVTAVEDQTANNYDLANVGTPTWEEFSWLWGYPAVVFNGSTDALKNTGGLANAMIGGIDRACQVYIVAQIRAIVPGGAAGNFWSCGDNASNNPFFRGLYTPTAMTLEYRKRDAATGAGSGAGGNGGQLDTRPHVYKFKHDGTACSINVDGNATFSGAMDVGDMGTMDNFAIGCLTRIADGGFGNIRVWALSVHDTLTAGQEAALDSLYWDTYLAPRGAGGGEHFRRRRL